MIFLQLFKCGFKEKNAFFPNFFDYKVFLHWNTKHFLALHYPTGNRFVSRTIIWSSDPPRSHPLSTVFEPIALSHVPIFFLFCCPHCLILTVYHHYSHHPPTLCFYTVPDFLLFSTFFPFICPVFFWFPYFSDCVIFPYSLYNTTGSPKASCPQMKCCALQCTPLPASSRSAQGLLQRKSRSEQLRMSPRVTEYFHCGCKSPKCPVFNFIL